MCGIVAIFNIKKTDTRASYKSFGHEQKNSTPWT